VKEHEYHCPKRNITFPDFSNDEGFCNTGEACDGLPCLCGEICPRLKCEDCGAGLGDINTPLTHDDTRRCCPYYHYSHKYLWKEGWNGA
jgi:hypothetical protein